MIVQPRQETFDDYSDISTTIVVNSDPDSYIQVDTDEVNSAVSHTVYNMNNYLSTDMTYFSGYYCYIYKYNDGRFALSLGLTVKSGHLWEKKSKKYFLKNVSVLFESLQLKYITL